jgi:hypothetical protein
MKYFISLLKEPGQLRIIHKKILTKKMKHFEDGKRDYRKFNCGKQFIISIERQTEQRS